MRYPKEIVLKDKTEAIIRPLEKQDEPKLRKLYAALPEKDRWFMRHDVVNPDVVHRMIAAIGKGNVISMVALVGDRVVAHASLLMRGYGCTRHVGRLRIAVMPELRHRFRRRHRGCGDRGRPQARFFQGGGPAGVCEEPAGDPLRPADHDQTVASQLGRLLMLE